MYEDTEKKESNLKSKIFKIIIFIIIALICFFLFKSLINPKDKTTSKNTFAQNFQEMKKVSEKYFTDDLLPTEIGKSSKVTLKQLIEKKAIKEIVDENGKLCSTANSYAEMTKTTENKYSLKVQLSCDSEQNYIISTITKNIEDDTDVTVNSDSVIEDTTESENNTNNETIQDTVINDNKTSTENKESVSSAKIPSKSSSSKNTTTNNNNNTNKNTANNNSNNSTNNSTTQNSNTNSDNKNDKTNIEFKTYYVVTFNPKGCKEIPTPQNIEKGKKAVKPADPIKVGYKFMGWYYNGQLFDFNTPINQSYALYAKWQKN